MTFDKKKVTLFQCLALTLQSYLPAPLTSNDSKLERRVVGVLEAADVSDGGRRELGEARVVFSRGGRSGGRSIGSGRGGGCRRGGRGSWGSGGGGSGGRGSGGGGSGSGGPSGRSRGCCVGGVHSRGDSGSVVGAGGGGGGGAGGAGVGAADGLRAIAAQEREVWVC